MSFEDLTLDQQLNILGLLATWITLIFVYKTLREMQVQRASSQLPDLVIPNIYIRANQSIIGKNYPLTWETQGIQGVNKEYIFFRMFNIGVGAAKNVEMVWDLGLEEAAEKIEEYCSKNSILISVSQNRRDWAEVNVSESSIAAGSVRNFSLKNTLVDFKDYLLPAVIQNEGALVNIPQVYNALLSIYLLLFSEGSAEENEDATFVIEDVPLKLEVKYRDIGNIEYRKKYRISFDLYILSTSVEAESFVRGQLKFTEI